MNEFSTFERSLCDACLLLIYSESREPLEFLDICVQCAPKIVPKNVWPPLLKNIQAPTGKRKKAAKPIFSRSELESGVCDCCSKNSLVQFIGEIPLCHECSTTFIASSASLRSGRLPTFAETKDIVGRKTASSKTICYFPESSDTDTDEQLYEECLEYNYSRLFRDIAQEYLEENGRDFEDCLMACGLLPVVFKSDKVKDEVAETSLNHDDILPSDAYLDKSGSPSIPEHSDLAVGSQCTAMATTTDELTVEENCPEETDPRSPMNVAENRPENDSESYLDDGLVNFVKIEEGAPSFEGQIQSEAFIDSEELPAIAKPSTPSLQDNHEHTYVGAVDISELPEGVISVEPGPIPTEPAVPLKVESPRPLALEPADLHCNSWTQCDATDTENKPFHTTPSTSVQVTPRKRGRPRKHPIIEQNTPLTTGVSTKTADSVSGNKEPLDNDSTLPTPRKRGRPRKYPVAENPVPKRPRGRPRKYPCGDSSNPRVSLDITAGGSAKQPVPRERPQVASAQHPLPSSQSKATASCFLTRGTTSKISKLVENELDVHRFEKHRRVKVLYNDGIWYIGRMMEISHGKIRIHYDDWDETHDEWIDSHSKRIYIFTSEEDEGPVSRRQKRLAIQSVVKLEDMNELASLVKQEPIIPEIRNYESTGADQGIVEYIEERTRERSTISVSASSVDESSPLPEEQLEEASEKYNAPGSIMLYEEHRSISQDINEPNFIDAWRDSAVSEQDMSKQKVPGIADLSRGYNLRSSMNLDTESTVDSPESATAKESKKRRTSHNIFKDRFKVGSTLEVRDRLKEWCTGVVMAIKGYRVLIHYEGWPSTHDEWIEINSKRLKPNTVIEKQEKFEEKELDRLVEEQIADIEKRVIIRRKKPDQKEEPVLMAEYFDESNIVEGVESEKWKVYCNQCKVVIKQIRYYCTYCENPSEGYDYESFDLCLWCFSRKFPRKHQHPRSSFAVEYIMEDANIELAPIIGELVTKYEKDIFDESYTEIDGKPYMQAVCCEEDRSHISLLKWKKRKICAFCNDEDPNILGGFIGPKPFVYIKVTNEGNKKRKSFWTHDACARYSPEVVQTKEGDWYNVSMALNRGRKMVRTEL
ncbi:hypothetical protein K493DRAFT_340602 [Basidiobolus meristosporus CBS 931.73]|uniref:ZZ-type domain-containing protein n=1 Tax=Basidiobolus meristosporus CBS 931.73 TaxID=1314790 RepID=A0A1Y1XUS0_9FUNG|nr:hypothetical protein K493DRAFT_340602 [Basidiobolus meristosporus CBS 931.73]|eukprot:ORX89490.1 hypothetical protein K493DRAFT_340602 [Basidiobolus meristosporus CBS 931.73]